MIPRVHLKENIDCIFTIQTFSWAGIVKSLTQGPMIAPQVENEPSKLCSNLLGIAEVILPPLHYLKAHVYNEG